MKKAKRESWNNFCNSITYKTTSKDLWAFVRRMKGIEPTTVPVFNIDNKFITDPKEKANILVKHYQQVSSNNGYSMEFINKKRKVDTKINKKVLVAETGHLDLPYNSDFTLFELDLALQNCKNGAPGADNINYGIIRNLPAGSKATLLELYNYSFWKEGKTPACWNEAIIIPLLKPNKNK